MKILEFLVLITIQIMFSTSASLPNTITPMSCLKMDPKYSECVNTYFDKIKALLIGGIPELYLPSLNPFQLLDIHYNETLVGNHGNIFGTVENIISTGYDQAQLNEYEISENSRQGELTIDIPLIVTREDHDLTAILNTVLGPVTFRAIGSAALLAKELTLNVVYKVNVKRIKYKKFFYIEKLEVDVYANEVEIQISDNNQSFQLIIDSILQKVNFLSNIALKFILPVVGKGLTLFARLAADWALGNMPINN